MVVSEMLPSLIATTMDGASCRPAQQLSIIEDELEWRMRPVGLSTHAAERRVTATRWRSLDQRTREVSAETPADQHLVAIALRTENIVFWIGQRVVHDGVVGAGTVHVTEPGIAARCIFRGSYDVLHLHVPNSLIAECAYEMGHPQPPALHSASTLARDMTVERLGRALLAAEETNGSFGALYADCISMSIVAWLLASPGPSQQLGRQKVAELPRWRLKRVMEYVEANLGESVTLFDLAAAAGLTRMHFARQFKAAIGVSPHEYLLRRRIERAQQMLVTLDTPLVDVALSVGFQAQSHFTSVFKRFTGWTPHAWRQTQARPVPAHERQRDWPETPITRQQITVGSTWF